jgi:transposase
MGEATTIGLDIAKSVFQAHGADAAGGVVFRKKLSRGRLLAFFAAQPSCVVAMEACAGRITGGASWPGSAIRCG